MRALEIVVRAAAIGHILRDQHEMPYGSAVIGDRRDIVAHPPARAVGQHIPCLKDKCLLVPERAPDRVHHIGQVIGVDEILDTHLQQLRRRAPDDAAKSIVGEREAPCGVDLREAHHRLAEHRAQNLLVAAQSDFRTSSRRNMRAHRETHNRDADHEHDQQQESVIGACRREWSAARQRSPDRKAGEN